MSSGNAAGIRIWIPIYSGIYCCARCDENNLHVVSRYRSYSQDASRINYAQIEQQLDKYTQKGELTAFYYV